LIPALYNSPYHHQGNSPCLTRRHLFNWADDDCPRQDPAKTDVAEIIRPSSKENVESSIRNCEETVILEHMREQVTVQTSILFSETDITVESKKGFLLPAQSPLGVDTPQGTLYVPVGHRERR